MFTHVRGSGSFSHESYVRKRCLAARPTGTPQPTSFGGGAGAGHVLQRGRVAAGGRVCFVLGEWGLRLPLIITLLL